MVNSRAPAEAEAAATPGGRDPALEIFRGISILEVVSHHISGFARLNAPADSLSNLFYSVANRSLHFAVPAFLFAMAVVLTRSVVTGKRSWSTFYRRRAAQTLMPYLVWTALYGIYRVIMGRMEGAGLLEPERWFTWLLWGKAWDHLYFLALALQLYLLLPLLLVIFGRLLRPLWLVLTVAVLTQLAFIRLNALVLHLPYPASTLVWHLTAVGAGVWLGARYDEWPEIWRRIRWIAPAAAAVGLALYLPMGLGELRRVLPPTIPYLMSYWLYTVSISFCLLALSGWIARRLPLLARPLQVAGVQSIVIYLVHPMLLFVWYQQPQSGSPLVFNLWIIAVFTGVILFSLGVGWLARRLGASNLLFGRSDFRIAPLPQKNRHPEEIPAQTALQTRIII